MDISLTDGYGRLSPAICHRLRKKKIQPPHPKCFSIKSNLFALSCVWSTEWQSTVKHTLVRWLIFNSTPWPKPDVQTMPPLPERACRIYQVVVCQQKTVDPCTVILSHRAGCYHSNLLCTLPSNWFRFILDTPTLLRDYESVCVCVCACLSVCPFVCFTGGLVTHEVWPSFHSAVNNWKVFGWIKRALILRMNAISGKSASKVQLIGVYD